MTAIELLAEACREHPFLTDLPWRVCGDEAITHLADLGRTYSEPDPDHPGRTRLIVVPPRKILPIIADLHASGWTRDGEPEAWDLWSVWADLHKDGAHLRVIGHATDAERPEGCTNSAFGYFFAPDAPPMTGRGWRKQWAEWDRKCRAAEW